MKKLTTSILAVGMMTGGLWAQDPSIINKVQGTMNQVQQKKTDDSNAALGITPSTNPSAKPAPGSTSKPVVIVPVSAAAPAPSPVQVKAKPAPAPAAAKTAPTPAKTQTATAAKTQTAPSAKKPAVAAHTTIVAAKETAPKATAKAVPSAPVKIAAEAKPADAPKTAEAVKSPKPEEKKPDEKKWAMSGKRDPFFSPVVQQPSGSGCSTGKKCLEIGQINLRGVVKSDNGFIAVVTNGLNKAYFLRENDPVFNGYVVKITGDAVVFQETIQDKLGKASTREVTKRIFTPAV
jgi:Tfp pilus assembly protein PilP